MAGQPGREHLRPVGLRSVFLAPRPQGPRVPLQRVLASDPDRAVQLMRDGGDEAGGPRRPRLRHRDLGHRAGHRGRRRAGHGTESERRRGAGRRALGGELREVLLHRLQGGNGPAELDPLSAIAGGHLQDLLGRGRYLDAAGERAGGAHFAGHVGVLAINRDDSDRRDVSQPDIVPGLVGEVGAAADRGAFRLEQDDRGPLLISRAGEHEVRCPAGPRHPAYVRADRPGRSRRVRRAGRHDAASLLRQPYPAGGEQACGDDRGVSHRQPDACPGDRGGHLGRVGQVPSGSALAFADANCRPAVAQQGRVQARRVRRRPGCLPDCVSDRPPCFRVLAHRPVTARATIPRRISLVPPRRVNAGACSTACASRRTRASSEPGSGST